MEEQPQEGGGIIDQLFQLLEQLILPNWPDLIRWVPWVLVLLVGGFLAFLAMKWFKAGERTRSRVPRPLAGGAPPPGIHMPGPSRWPFVVPIGAALLLFGLALPPRDAGGNPTSPVNLPLFGLGLLVSLIAVAGWLWDAMREWRSTATPEGHGPAAAHAAHVSLMIGGTAVAAAPAPAYQEPPPGVHMPGPSPWPFFAPIGAMVMLYGVIFSPVLLIGGLVLSIIAVTGWYLEAGREYRSTEAVGHAVPATRDPYAAWPRRLVPVFIGVVVVSFAITLAPLGIGWLNSLTPAEATPPPVSVPAVPEISADSAVSFNTKTLIVPAGRPFELVFTNNDAGVPHNVEIDDSAQRTTVLFDGEVINGVATVTYQVPALDPGDYYFLCKIHPNMNGTLSAMPESGPPPPAGGSGGETAAPQASAPAEH